MLGNRKLIVDTHCEIYNQIKDCADGIFWNLEQYLQKNQVESRSIYIIGREQIRLYGNLVRELIDNFDVQVVFSNPHEGSETLKNHCYSYGISDLALAKKIILVGGGDMDPSWTFLQYEVFLTKVLDYEENIQAVQKYQELEQDDRPYKFLFLNGATRYHRAYMLNRLTGLLDHAIWTNLSSGNGVLKKLEPRYELDHFNLNVDLTDQTYIKDKIFPKNTWGDILIKAEPYLDTYFSLVSETVHRYPYSFRTEKI